MHVLVVVCSSEVLEAALAGSSTPVAAVQVPPAKPKRKNTPQASVPEASRGWKKGNMNGRNAETHDVQS